MSKYIKVYFKYYKIHKDYTLCAGSNLPSHDPKPTLKLKPSQTAFMVMVSPSWMNFLSLPSTSLTGLVPLQDSSKRLPKESEA